MADETGDWWTNNQPRATGWDPAKFASIVGRPPTPDETAFYSAVPTWETDVRNAAGGGSATTPGQYGAGYQAPPSSGGGGGGQAWINQTLQSVQSTDDPGYWAGVIGADPKAMAGDPSAIAYWQDRIRRGDGSALVKSGQLQKVNDSSVGGTGNWQSGQGVTPTELSSYGVPSSPYASAAYGSSYQSPAVPAGLSSPYTLPTQAELEATPGYQARMDAGERTLQNSAAAKGSILNGGTQKALARYGQDYASNEYSNLVGQSLGARQQNQGEYQANVVAPAQVTYQNQYRQYLDDQNRQLNDYLTNYNINRTGVQDFLGQQNKTADRGLQATYYGRPS